MKGLYLHIPFCERKCIYCDFYSIEAIQGIDTFIDSLIQEIKLSARLHNTSDCFDTIFFGGGTPSLLSPHQLEKIIDALHSHLNISPDAECTVETNPGTVDINKLRAYKHLGVNRLSIGVQSFYNDELKFLGRIHTAESAIECFNNTRAAEFDNVNIDLIFALPQQTRKRWRTTLEKAVSLNPDHISAYNLTYEPGTPLFTLLRNKVVTPLPDEQEAIMYEITLDEIERGGYHQYEVSNFAHRTKECKHNLTYWNHGEYLGFGPSAHSYFNGKRFWNTRSLKIYNEGVSQGKLPRAGEEMLTTDEYIEETIFLGLRSQGINLEKLKKLFNLDLLHRKTQNIEQYLRERFISIEGEWLRVTRKGRLFSDLIAQDLFI